MKAIVGTKYGLADGIQLQELDKPAPNKEHQVLVKVHAASLNYLDLQIRGGLARIWSGFRKPKDPRLGADLAGQVEAVGSSVTEFKPGDEVFGVCKGSFAEYALARDSRLALKPANLTFEQAAAVPVAGITALQGLRDKGHIQAGQKVLINGASGGVGTFAVLIAKAFGAEVTAVCSTRNVEQARAMGADHVIDYTREDFTRNGQQYDLILAVNGYQSIFAYRRALSPKGVYVMAGASSSHIFPALIQTALFGRLFTKAGAQSMGFMGIADVIPKDMAVLIEFLESGKIAPVIEKRYPLSETAAALRYLAEGHARAKVIITVP